MVTRRTGDDGVEPAGTPAPAPRALTGLRGRLRRAPRDSVAMSCAALLFTTALGLSSVALPLLALEVGRSAGEVGLLVALSAVVQIFARSRLGVVMRRLPDRTLIAFAPLALALAFVVLLLSSSLPGLALAWVVLGLARACFWTGSQTHAVQGPGISVRRLATLNLFGSVGALLGPVLAGVLAEDALSRALWAGAALAALAFFPTLGLERFAPFARKRERHERRMWRRPGVDAACGAGAAAGAWRGMMDSFVPVVLERAKHSSTTIGVLVSVANAATVFGAVLVGRLRPSTTRAVYVASMLAAALGLAGLGYAAAAVAAAAVALGVSGLGAGVLQTLGPALAATAVAADEKGDAMAAYGTVRTSAMFVTPLATAGAVAVLPLSLALLLVGSLLAVPVIAVRSVQREQQSVPPPPKA